MSSTVFKITFSFSVLSFFEISKFSRADGSLKNRAKEKKVKKKELKFKWKIMKFKCDMWDAEKACGHFTLGAETTMRERRGL